MVFGVLTGTEDGEGVGVYVGTLGRLYYSGSQDRDRGEFRVDGVGVDLVSEG